MHKLKELVFFIPGEQICLWLMNASNIIYVHIVNVNIAWTN